MIIDIGRVLCPQCKFMKKGGVVPAMSGRGEEILRYCSAPYPIFARPSLLKGDLGFLIRGSIIYQGCDLFEECGDERVTE